MIVRLEIQSDTIFGSGMSIPGAEDISVLTDKDGFPYLKGATLRGVLREEAENYVHWLGLDADDSDWLVKRFGKEGADPEVRPHGITVSDFTLPLALRNLIKGENMTDIQELFTSLRTFTKLDNGVAQDTSLRVARCINAGYIFYGEVQCHPEDETLLEEILSSIKWIGSMRTRGFGKVRVSVLNEGKKADGKEEA